MNFFWLAVAINMQELVNKLQYMVDHETEEGYTFPDGDFWPKTGTREFELVWGKRG